ncbi:DUF6932 family protein [Paenibacillus tengchongensis]|uniref:DUF6932 family protein n=1 Tax=Paenibacillus tengchongensis TaxID=2608684 RepID=UPI00124D924A|nr:hypothetical protein [Paenibacillus tengchongensis]
MPIPDFNKNGYLPKGLHKCSSNEFYQRFCVATVNKPGREERLDGIIREQMKDIFEEMLYFAAQRGSKMIIFGGSFITNQPYPDDIDCIIIVPNEKCIPSKSETFIVSNCKIDAIFITEDNEENIYRMINLFSRNRFNMEVGLVGVLVDDSEDITDYDDYDEFYNLESHLEDMLIYTSRHIITGYQKKGLLITIHGLNTYAEWNYELAPIVSSDHWIFAPFRYGNVKSPLLKDGKKIIEQFRDWVYEIKTRYRMNPSVIAHSYGTFVLASYLHLTNSKPAVTFNDIILTGSILSPHFDWKSCFDSGSVKRVYNLIAPNDPWVPHIEKIKWINNHPLYGNSGVTGFEVPEDLAIFQEERIPLFDHSSMLKRDVFEQKVMRFLNASRLIQ